MFGWNWKSKAAGAVGAAWRERRSERYGGETVRCALGEILDVSASGMRVICDGKPPVQPGGAIPIRLRFSDGSLQVGAQVRWCKRRGLKRYEIGLKFIQLKPGVAKVLEAIARFGLAEAAKHMDDPSDRSKRQGQQKQKPKKPRVEVDLPNYYRVLELEPDATITEIKASYRKLATRYHPDRNDAPDAMHRFEAINEAYHILSDPQTRDNYARMAG